jgi:hypothetical protein
MGDEGGGEEEEREFMLACLQARGPSQGSLSRVGRAEEGEEEGEGGER